MRWIYDADESAPGSSYCKQACGDHALETPCDECQRPYLMPENIEVVNVFHACDTQWKFAASGIRLGLEYPSILAVMQLRETENKKDVFHGLKIMESEVINIALENFKKTNGD